MGINFILPLIAGIVMTVILGSQVAPSLVENMKIAKVENRTIANQNLIKDAITKYIKLEGKAPTGMEDLKTFILMQEQNNNNLFNGNYTYELVKLPDGRYNGTLKIFTTINDESASKYFSNSFKFPNKPICTKSGSNYDCETFYQLDMDVFDVFAKLKEKEENAKLLDFYKNINARFSFTNTSATIDETIDPDGIYKNFKVNIIYGTPDGLLEKVFPNTYRKPNSSTSNSMTWNTWWIPIPTLTAPKKTTPNRQEFFVNEVKERIKIYIEKELGL